LYGNSHWFVLWCRLLVLVERCQTVCVMAWTESYASKMACTFAAIYDLFTQPFCPLSLCLLVIPRTRHWSKTALILEPLWHAQRLIGRYSTDLFPSVLHRFFLNEVVPTVQKDVYYSRNRNDFFEYRFMAWITTMRGQ
jgi:hypothetical protein